MHIKQQQTKHWVTNFTLLTIITVRKGRRNKVMSVCQQCYSLGLDMTFHTQDLMKEISERFAAVVRSQDSSPEERDVSVGSKDRWNRGGQKWGGDITQQQRNQARAPVTTMWQRDGAWMPTSQAACAWASYPDFWACFLICTIGVIEFLRGLKGNTGSIWC